MLESCGGGIFFLWGNVNLIGKKLIPSSVLPLYEFLHQTFVFWTCRVTRRPDWNHSLMHPHTRLRICIVLPRVYCSIQRMSLLICAILCPPIQFFFYYLLPNTASPALGGFAALAGSKYFSELIRSFFFTPFTHYLVPDLFQFTANYDIIKCPSEVKSENEFNKPRVCNSAWLPI